MPTGFVQNASPYGMFLQEQLRRTLPKLYEVNYDELWALNAQTSLHTAIADLPLGLEFFEAYAMSDAGQMAALYDGLGDDIPVVDVQIGKLPPVPVAVFIQGAWWSEMDLQKMQTAQSAGLQMPTMDIVSAKQKKVGDYFNRREHYTALYGYPKKGLYGIFSLRGVNKQDNTFQPYKKTAGAYDVTTKQLYDDLSDLIYAFMTRARISNPSQVVMVLPPKLARRSIEIYNDPNNITVTGMTVKQMLQSQELGLGINILDSRNELAGDSLTQYVPNESNTAMFDSTYDRIMFKTTGYNLERHFYPRRPKPVFQVNSLKYEQVTLGATSGIMNFEPEKVWYYDFKNNVT